MRFTVVIWDTETGVEKRRFKLYTPPKVDGPQPITWDEMLERYSRFRAMAFRNDQSLFIVDTNSLLVLDLATGDAKPRHEFHDEELDERTPEEKEDAPPPRISSIALSADQKLLAVGTTQRTIYIFDTTTWKKAATLKAHQRSITSLAFSSDGRRIASSSGKSIHGGAYDKDETPGEVIVWDTRTWESSLVLSRDEPREYSAVFFGDGDRSIYAACNEVKVGAALVPEGEIIAWGNGAKEQPSEPVPVKKRRLAGSVLMTPANSNSAWIRALAINRTGTQIAGVTQVHNLFLWDVATGEVIGNTTQRLDTPDPWTLMFTPDGKGLISGVSGLEIAYRRVPSLDRIRSQAFGESPLLAAVVKNDRFLTVERNARKEVEIVDGASRTPLPSILAPQFPGSTVSRDFEYCAVQTGYTVDYGPKKGQGEPYVLHVLSLSEKREVYNQRLEGWAELYGFSADGQMIAASQVLMQEPTLESDRRIDIFDIPSKRSVKRFTVTGRILAFTPDLSRCLIHTQDGVFGFNLETGRRTETPCLKETNIVSAVFFPDNRHFAWFGQRTLAKIATIEPEEK